MKMKRSKKEQQKNNFIKNIFYGKDIIVYFCLLPQILIVLLLFNKLFTFYEPTKSMMLSSSCFTNTN